MRPPKKFHEGTSNRLAALLEQAVDLAEYRRIQSVLMRSRNNMDAASIAALTGLGVNTVRILHSRFLREGEACLLSRRGKRKQDVESQPKSGATAKDERSPARVEALPPDANENIRTGPECNKTKTTVGMTVTLRDVAARAGVSHTTVSLALRNSPTLPAKTCDRIRRHAEALGYRPDPRMHELMDAMRARRINRRPDTLAYLIAYPDRETWKKDQSLFRYYEGVRAQANACGYQLEIFWLYEPGMTDRRLGEIIRNRGIDGVIIAPLPRSQLLFQDFPWHYFSAVELGYSLAKPRLCRACHNHFLSMQRLVNRLHARGYRNIGLAMEEGQDTRVLHLWRGAFSAAADLLPGKRRIPMLVPETWKREYLEAWLKKYRPDVVISVGMEVCRWLAADRIHKKDTPDFATADLLSAMGDTTGIDQNSQQIGVAAVDLLISLMRTNARGIPAVPRIVMVEGEFVQGTTMHVEKLTPFNHPAAARAVR
ncbi:LacI family transcriptional regulator [Opitutaceae bacterium TAV5]|nr:LacI family transcriptional regulator [Opitutaceae bacterium TAV5]